MYLATYTIDITALFYLIGLLHSSTALKFYRKKPFLIAIILTIIVILSEAGTVFADNEYLNLRSINLLCNILGFALTPIIPIAITLIFDERIFKSHKLLLLPTLINIVATVLSPLYGYIFYIDPNNLYSRGDYFFVFIIAYIINLLLLLISTLETGKNYNYPIMWKLLALSLFTLLGTSIQLVFPLAYSSWHCVTLSLLLYFLLMSEFDSSFDALTGLYNRAAFDKAIKQKAESRANAFSVIILDINDFKNVNDTYGHDYGDNIIKLVAAIIQKSFNKQYTCYRFGGDEFSVISSETDQEKIEHQLRNMTSNLEAMREKDYPLPTVSYGFSIFRGGGKPDFRKIFKDADDQMYHYKKIHKAKASQEKTKET